MTAFERRRLLLLFLVYSSGLILQFQAADLTIDITPFDLVTCQTVNPTDDYYECYFKIKSQRFKMDKGKNTITINDRTLGSEFQTQGTYQFNIDSYGRITTLTPDDFVVAQTAYGSKYVGESSCIDSLSATTCAGTEIKDQLYYAGKVTNLSPDINTCSRYQITGKSPAYICYILKLMPTMTAAIGYNLRPTGTTYLFREDDQDLYVTPQTPIRLHLPGKVMDVSGALQTGLDGYLDFTMESLPEDETPIDPDKHVVVVPISSASSKGIAYIVDAARVNERGGKDPAKYASIQIPQLLPDYFTKPTLAEHTRITRIENSGLTLSFDTKLAPTPTSLSGSLLGKNVQLAAGTTVGPTPFQWVTEKTPTSSGLDQQALINQPMEQNLASRPAACVFTPNQLLIMTGLKYGPDAGTGCATPSAQSTKIVSICGLPDDDIWNKYLTDTYADESKLVWIGGSACADNDDVPKSGSITIGSAGMSLSFKKGGGAGMCNNGLMLTTAQGIITGWTQIVNGEKFTYGLDRQGCVWVVMGDLELQLLDPEIYPVAAVDGLALTGRQISTGAPKITLQSWSLTCSTDANVPPSLAVALACQTCSASTDPFNGYWAEQVNVENVQTIRWGSDVQRLEKSMQLPRKPINMLIMFSKTPLVHSLVSQVRTCDWWDKHGSSYLQQNGMSPTRSSSSSSSTGSGTSVDSSGGSSGSGDDGSGSGSSSSGGSNSNSTLGNSSSSSGNSSGNSSSSSTSDDADATAATSNIPTPPRLPTSSDWFVSSDILELFIFSYQFSCLLVILGFLPPKFLLPIYGTYLDMLRVPYGKRESLIEWSWSGIELGKPQEITTWILAVSLLILRFLFFWSLWLLNSAGMWLLLIWWIIISLMYAHDRGGFWDSWTMTRQEVRDYVNAVQPSWYSMAAMLPWWSKTDLQYHQQHPWIRSVWKGKNSASGGKTDMEAPLLKEGQEMMPLASSSVTAPKLVEEEVLLKEKVAPLQPSLTSKTEVIKVIPKQGAQSNSTKRNAEGYGDPYAEARQ